MKKKIYLIISFVIFIFMIFTLYRLINNKVEINNKKNINNKIEIINNNDNSNIVLEYQKEFNNEDIIGNLYIENTNINTPIVQGSDNSYYLNHLVDKTYNGLGSNFLDSRNKLSDKKLIIYGHNSHNIYTDFNTLENYLDEDYYNDHKYMYLTTSNDNFKYIIFSIFIESDNYDYINLNFNEDDYYKHLKYLKNKSLYDTEININKNDDVLLLQTCYIDKDNSFIIIVGKKL